MEDVRSIARGDGAGLERVVEAASSRSGRELAEAVLGPVLTERTRTMLHAHDDLLVALASPEFQRR